MATTPCPHCAHEVPVPDEPDAVASCPGCGGRLRFEEVPERPCDGCGEPLALPPGARAVTCAACGLVQAPEAGRGAVAVVRCPRCRRRLELPVDARRVDCTHCGATMDVEQPS